MAIDVASLTAAGAATDAVSLRQRQDLQAASQQFEAVLLHKVVQAMRATVPSAEGVTGQQMYDHLIDQALATHLSEGGGVGVARMLDQALAGREAPAPVRREVPALISSTDAGDLPLAEQLPPQYDPWMHSPDAAAQIYRSFAGDPGPAEKSTPDI
jgi:Rod binding domain-containing protein